MERVWSSTIFQYHAKPGIQKRSGGNPTPLLYTRSLRKRQLLAGILFVSANDIIKIGVLRFRPKKIGRDEGC